MSAKEIIDINNIQCNKTSINEYIVRYKGEDRVRYTVGIWHRSKIDNTYSIYVNIKYKNRIQVYHNDYEFSWMIPACRKGIVDQLVKIFDSYYLIDVLI